MELSFAGIIGAAVGAMASAVVYVPLIGVIDRALRSGRPPSGASSVFELEVALLRRVILAIDMVVFAGIGYWVGWKIGG